VIVLMLWFYLSGIALVLGAELNATIEHASPYGKAPGQKGPTGRRLLGARAAKAFAQRQPAVPVVVAPVPPKPSPTLGLVVATGVLLTRAYNRRSAATTIAEPQPAFLDSADVC
jgi:membrane protein